MLRVALVLAATLAAVPAARARPQTEAETLRPGGDVGLRGGLLLGVATGVNLLGSTVIAYEVASGKSAVGLSGLSLLATGPALAFTVSAIRHDPGDVLLYGSAAWTAALVGRAVYELLRHHDPSSRRSNDGFILQPLFDPGSGLPAAGLDVAGQF
jgi:hypothetical protein